jgi:hypothetical protein
MDTGRVNLKKVVRRCGIRGIAPVVVVVAAALARLRGESTLARWMENEVDRVMTVALRMEPCVRFCLWSTD